MIFAGEEDIDMPRWFWSGLFVLGLFVAALPASAQNLPQPEGKPILTVSGKITNLNSDKAAIFDRVMLEGLGTDNILTKTPWHDGVTEFSGVRLDKLIAFVGAQGRFVTAVALNDYMTKIPIEDFSDFRVILALKRDGKYMTVRDKGPLFIIYPFDDDPSLRSQVYFGRSAWQVTKLIVE